jgi:cobalamin biosynthesis protein CbiG
MLPSNKPSLFVGIGLSREAIAADAIALVERAISASGIKAAHIEAIATIASRRDDPVVISVASHLRCGILAFDAEVLERETPRLRNPSDDVFARIGCHGVAEAAALAAAGKDAVLIVEKISGRRLTAAIAGASAIF